MLSVEIVILLIEYAADVNAESDMNYTVLDYAEMVKDEEIIEILKVAGAK